MHSDIRVRLSGFILFVSNIISFLFGFIFIILVSRNLSQHDLGIWFYIGSIITYFEFFIKVIPYWAIRDFARGKRIAKTALMISSIISIPLMICFLILAWLLSAYVKIDISIFLVASLLIPAYYISASINSILYAKYPHKVSWRVPIIDGLKIPLAILLLPYGLTGVLAAVVTANFLYTLYGIYIIKREFEKTINYLWLKYRSKHAWLPIMQSGIGYINSATDSFLVGALLSPIQLSLYGVGITIANAVKTSSQLTLPFSMRILAKTTVSRKEVTSIVKFLTMFSIPMLIGGTLLSENLCRIFGPAYVGGSSILWILLFSSVMISYASIFSGIMSGTEKIDYDANVSFRSLMRSKLFTVNFIDYTTTAVLIMSLLILVPRIGITGAALSRLLSSSTSLIILSILCLKYIDAKKILKNIGKSIIACIPMAVYLMFFTYPRAIVTVLNIFLGAIIYFFILCLIDRESRGMVKVFAKELSQRMLSMLE